ncbi:MAG: hypothetical protein JXA18_13395 [Chitinispirillaceae bacterium]|nr:hypothetical protein [Chitinispirillaceae bacterium]
MRTVGKMPVALLAAICFPAAAQEIDEDALFGDTAITMIDSSSLKVASAAIDGVDSTAVSFSGGVTAVSETGLPRDWFSTRDRSEVDPGALMLGDLMLDVRLPFGMKAFSDGEIYCSPDSNGLTFAVPEIFLDAAINRRVYLRAGKQVLQWGRGYFWNPTDLVNVERKTFIQRIGSREGTFGLKTHIPFRTKWNVYGFLDMNNLASVDSLAGAARFEGLFGGTEAGVSMWGKRGKFPIFGFDFSATLLSWSITGEMSVTRGTNYRILDMENSRFFTGDEADSLFALKDFGTDPVVRLCAGFFRMFDLLDIDDRMMVVGEFYFNQAGDGGNSFKKYHAGKLYDSIMALPAAGAALQQAGVALRQGFEFNSLAKCYGAFFITISKFIISDMTLQLNGLVNFNHGCAMLTGGVQYATLHNFSLGCLVTGFAGPEESEYTFMGTGASVRLTAGVTF